MLPAALQVFARGGDRATTNRAVATEAGFGSAGVRHRLSTRHEVLVAKHVARSPPAVAEGIQNKRLADRTVDVDEHVRQAWRGRIT